MVVNKDSNFCDRKCDSKSAENDPVNHKQPVYNQCPFRGIFLWETKLFTDLSTSINSFYNKMLKTDYFYSVFSRPGVCKIC